LAVGRMVVEGDKMNEAEKGKAVKVLHTWKDALWQLGGGGDIPAPTVATNTEAVAADHGDGGPGHVEGVEESQGAPPDTSSLSSPRTPPPQDSPTTLSPQGLFPDSPILEDANIIEQK
jgi:translation initiation factor 2D